LYPSVLPEADLIVENLIKPPHLHLQWSHPLPLPVGKLLEKKEGNFVHTFKLNTAKNSFSLEGKSLCPT